MRAAFPLAVRGEGNIGTLAVPIAVLVAAVIVLGLAVRFTRRRWRRAGTVVEPAWTLQRLRELHARAELTDAEYEKLRAAMIASLKTAHAEDAPATEKAEGS